MLWADVPVPEKEPAGVRMGVAQLNLTLDGRGDEGINDGAEPLQTESVSDPNERTGVGLTVTTRSKGVKEIQDPALA